MPIATDVDGPAASGAGECPSRCQVQSMAILLLPASRVSLQFPMLKLIIEGAKFAASCYDDLTLLDGNFRIA
jgi:hypothetical protein